MSFKKTVDIEKYVETAVNSEECPPLINKEKCMDFYGYQDSQKCKKCWRRHFDDFPPVDFMGLGVLVK